MSKATPWSGWLNLAIALGLAPDCFWRLSLREWRAITSRGANDVLTRTAFDNLAARFPDQKR